jgi:anti-anti-sigma factor
MGRNGHPRDSRKTRKNSAAYSRFTATRRTPILGRAARRGARRHSETPDATRPVMTSGAPNAGGVDLVNDGRLSIITIRGEHDLSTVASLRLVLDRALSAGSSCIVDFTQADFIDSTVLGALIDGRNRAAGDASQQLVLVAPPGTVAHRLFALTALHRLMPCFATLTDAVTALERSTDDHGLTDRPDASS